MIIINQENLNKIDESQDDDVICFLPSKFQLVANDDILKKIESYFEKEEQLKAIVCNYSIFNKKENIEYNHIFQKNGEDAAFFVKRKFVEHKEDLCIQKIIKNGLVFHFPEPVFRITIDVD